MRKANICNINFECELAKTIYSSNGAILLAKGTKLNSKLLDRLKIAGINEIYIEDKISQDIEIEDIITEKTRMESKKIIIETMNDIKMHKEINYKAINSTVHNIINDILSNDNILINLSDIKTNDDYTFSHSVNVCILSIVVGVSLGYDEQKLKKLGIGTLLHDIGKIIIPQEILNKPGKLTEDEFEIMKTHTVKGYDMLKNKIDIEPLSRYVVLSHHEKWDGSGYPNNLKGENIHEFARISSITDVYDALTSHRVYRKKMQPYEAMEYILAMSNTQFDGNIVKKFYNHVAIYPNGTIIKLNTGDVAIVIDSNQKMPTRPLVKLILDPRGRKYISYHEINLQKELTVFIDKVLE